MKNIIYFFIIVTSLTIPKIVYGADNPKSIPSDDDLKNGTKVSTNKNYCDLIYLWRKKGYSKKCELHTDCPEQFKCNCSDKVDRSELYCLSHFPINECIPVAEELRFDATKKTPCDLKKDK